MLLDLETILLCGRIVALTTEQIQSKLKREGIENINPTQALILLCMGTKPISIGGIVHSGYYPGSNISYNIKKLKENKYISYRISDSDRRVVLICATKAGQKVQSYLETLVGNDSDLEQLRSALLALENRWRYT